MKINGRGYAATILWTILLAGTLDISAAFLNSLIRSGLKPIIVLQYIASGVLGQQSFAMGWISGLMGLLLHFLFVAIWTLIFFWCYPKLKIDKRFKVISGFFYGLLIWLIMNLAVVPLSATKKFPLETLSIILGVLYVVFMVGLPVSLMFHHYLSKAE